MRDVEEQEAIRADIFRWLDEQLGTGKSEFTHIELKNYTYKGERIPLKDGQRGIWNPKDFESTLSITTSLKDQYNDELGDDFSLLYSYQTRDGGDNLKMFRAMDDHVPLTYFRAIRSGTYVAYYPAYVVGANNATRKFSVMLDESFRFFSDPLAMTLNQRRYAERLVKQRLHQPVFRAQVMRAYSQTCAVCLLKHADLLDAAHILEDADVNGFASVDNGLALCKLHHAAYDRDLLGITPDYVVQINQALMEEVDGPMLRHGLQGMQGRSLFVPSAKRNRPSADALAQRFEKFLS
jgi:putative restriction endonuclease